MIDSYESLYLNLTSSMIGFYLDKQVEFCYEKTGHRRFDIHLEYENKKTKKHTFRSCNDDPLTSYKMVGLLAEEMKELITKHDLFAESFVK